MKANLHVRVKFEAMSVETKRYNVMLCFVLMVNSPRALGLSDVTYWLILQMKN
jgi:hypothetical protein